MSAEMTVLALEISTSGVRAAVARDGRTRVLRLGDEQDAMPGAVLLDENGSLVLGTRALSLGVHLPGRLLTDLPGLLEDGRTILGNRVVDVEEILPALVRHVHEQCAADIGTSEWQLRLVVPGSWGPACRRRIAQALTKTGVDNSVVAAPVALAHRLADLPEPRTMLAVADFGAGGLECSVLVRGGSGYELVSAPVVRRDVGGDHLDQRILTHVVSGNDELAGAIEQLLSPTTAEGRNLALALYAEVRRVKERLGEARALELHVPGRDAPVQVTHAEFEACAGPDIKAVADTLEEAIESAGCRSKDLGEVLLAGGSSRIPMVSSEVWRRLELSRPPVLLGHEDSGSAFEPGSQAVLGALRTEDYRPPQMGQRVQTRPEAAATSTSAAPGGRNVSSLGGRLAGVGSLLRESTPAKVISGASVLVVVVLLIVLLGGSASAIDPCLVGSWVETEQNSQVSYGGDSITLTGLTGEVLAFTAKGVETVDYSKATPLSGPFDGSTYALSYGGTIKYVVRTKDGKLSFSDGNFSRYEQSATLGGQPLSLNSPGDPGPVSYTCTKSDQVQSSSGYHATFRRT